MLGRVFLVESFFLTSNEEEAEVEWFCEDLQDLWELTLKKRCPFQYKRLEWKSRNTWSNRQIWPWSTKWSRAKANRVLPKECTDHSKQPLPTTQEKTLHMDITRWLILKSDWLYYLQLKMEKLYIVSQTRPWTDCGSNNELLISKFRLKLNKVGKSTRPFSYDLNQNPCDYTEEVRKIFKGVDLIECLKNYGQSFVTLYRRQGSRPSPWKRNAKGKMIVWGDLTNSCEERSEKQRRKGKIYPFKCRVPKNSKKR